MPFSPKVRSSTGFCHLARRLVWTFRALRAAFVQRWIVHFGSRQFHLSAGPVLVIAPHQDDETLACGGMIALKCAAGSQVAIVFLTDGRKSATSRSTMNYDGNSMASLRRAEAIAASHLLGVEPEDIHFLDNPDGELAEMAGASREITIARLSSLISQYQPDEVFVPHRRDRHPDHEAACQLAIEASLRADHPTEILQYMIWKTWLTAAIPDYRVRTIDKPLRLLIAPVLKRKVRAIRAYRSQISTFPFGFLGRFCAPYELYYRLRRNL